MGQGILSGYRTYILAAMGVLGAVAGYLVGDLSLADAGQLVLTSAIGATIRGGIKADVKS
jgi:hypothetical protein